MKRADFYQELLPKIIRRLFIAPVAAGLFLVFWYLLGGNNLWGHLLSGVMQLCGLSSVSFEPGAIEKAALLYKIKGPKSTAEVVFQINQLNSNLVVLVTLFTMWPHKSIRDALKLSVWLFVFIVFYQCLSFLNFAYEWKLSPDAADHFKDFWEPSLWYTIIYKISSFDKFILRYFAAFPVAGAALTARHFFDTWWRNRSKSAKSGKARKK